MSNTAEKSSKNTSADEQNAIRRAVKAKRQANNGRGRLAAPSVDIMTAAKNDRIAAAKQRKLDLRDAYITRLAKMVMNARMVADETLVGQSTARIREIVDMTFDRWYLMSLNTPHNTTVKFADAKSSIVTELKTEGAYPIALIVRATYDAVDFLAGAYAMDAFGKTLDQVVSSYKANLERRLKNRATAPKAPAKARELVSAT